ncbi:helix-turn-helix transcriptional regulator [Leifsonia poae]|uniref:helix-turn-helix transcriptional regulator n=1 Tax=Leifsonia poae TaxID=110933 RepID=UPI001CC09776|nr:LuxR family transcriptional regulator [Leifsonia poae]
MPVSPAAVPHPALAEADRPAAVFDEARRSGGTLVSVTGLTGVGKSTWTRQFAAAASRHRVVAVGADAFEKDFPFGLVDKLAHAAGLRLGILGESGSPDPLAVARVLLPALARDTSPARRLIVVIDNAQWIDDASLAVLRFVLSRVAHGGVCLVLSGHDPRTAEIGAQIVSADEAAWSTVRAVRLEPLDAAHVRDYVSRVHDIEVSLRLAQRIRERSGGLPVLIDVVVSSMERPADAARAHWDEDVTLAAPPQNPFQRVDAGQPANVVVAVEIAAVLRDAVARSELVAVASALGEEAGIDDALAAGLLIPAGAGAVAPFHDLYCADVLARLPEERRRVILGAAADVLPNSHRAFLCRLNAARTIDTTLLTELRRLIGDAAAGGHPDRAIGYLRKAAELADVGLRAELVVESCLLAAATLVSPTVIDLIPDLERMPSDPVRDLALLQTRQITGDTAWAAGFAAELLSAPIEHPDALLLQTHASMMAVMVQLTTDDYRPLLGMLDRTRSFAVELAEGPRTVSDPRLAPLLTPEDVELRCIGLTIVAAARLGDAERVGAEIGALSAAISTAADSPALVDALTCRAGVLAGVGVVEAAAADLERGLAIAASGVAGWSLGHARVLLAYCYWILGCPIDAASLLETATLVALDSIDVSSRPLIYLLRAVLAAVAGDEQTHAADLRTAVEVTVTDYDTFGVELELLAAVENARAADRPEGVLDALSDERIGGRWLAGASIFSFRVDALAALGRAEEADRELTRLRGLAGAGWTPIYGSLDWLEGRVAEAYGLTERALRSYRAAAASSTLPAPRAQAEFDAGRLLLATGDRRTAERMLRSAAAAYRRLGAGPALRRTIALLDGQDSSSAHFERLESLSAREREVARLAESGMTNAEIARTLYLSVPTVNFHIRNVLAKLGLTSRRELRTVLRADG